LTFLAASAVGGDAGASEVGLEGGVERELKGLILYVTLSTDPGSVPMAFTPA
jgi:hypothetical protein